MYPKYPNTFICESLLPMICSMIVVYMYILDQLLHILSIPGFNLINYSRDALWERVWEKHRCLITFFLT